MLTFQICYGSQAPRNAIESIGLKQYKGGSELFLKTTHPVQVFSSGSTAPPVIKIEFKSPLIYRTQKEILLEKNSPIQRIKLLTTQESAKKNEILISHLVVELKQPLAYEIEKKHNKVLLKLFSGKRNKEIEAPQEKKHKEDSPERIIEKDFIEFIKKARVKWQKEEEVIKKLLSNLERERLLEENRLRRQKQLKADEAKKKEIREKKLKVQQEAKIKKEESAKKKKEKQQNRKMAAKKDEPKNIQRQVTLPEEDLGVILITKQESQTAQETIREEPEKKPIPSKKKL
ncbi:MAG: hypothetical protein V1893_02230 [Candidatus Omnitrophota bacterium]